MTIKKSMNRCFILALFIAFIIFFTGGLRAQISSIDSLHSIITAKEDSLKQLDQIRKRIEKSFDVLNTKIFKQKKELETSSNPLIRLRLQANLKESAMLAAKLDKLQKQRQRILRELQSNYRQIITVTDSIIKQKMQGIQEQQNNRSQLAALNLISILEKEKKIWQKKLIELTPDVTEKPLLKIEPDDNIERLQLKIKLLQDHIRQVDGELKKLHKRRADLQSDLQIYEEMLSFMDNLQQNIDPDEEYFDQERNDQLKDDMRNTKLKISAIEERVKQLMCQKTDLENKLQKFKEYLKKMLNQ